MSLENAHLVTITVNATTKAELVPGTFTEDWDCTSKDEADQLAERLWNAIHREIDQWLADRSSKSPDSR